MNNALTEMENTLEGVKRRITEVEGQISELEETMARITAMEQR